MALLLHHTFVTRLLDLGVPIEQVNYLAGHKSMAMTKRYDHAREERYGGAIEALDEAGKTGSAEAFFYNEYWIIPIKRSLQSM
jgi:integrase